MSGSPFNFKWMKGSKMENKAQELQVREGELAYLVQYHEHFVKVVSPSGKLSVVNKKDILKTMRATNIDDGLLRDYILEQGL